jgi:uncharacterized protein
MSAESGSLDPRLLEILACPKDKGPLIYFADEDSLYNPRLRLRYHVRDGIPVMLVDEADEVDESEDARLKAKASNEGLAPTFEAETPADPPEGP